MALLFTDYFTRTYKSGLMTVSTIIFSIFMALAFIMPIILVVKTHNFWVTNLTFNEQPKV
jgi:hypothetical protein